MARPWRPNHSRTAKDGSVRIEVTIYVARSGHKAILIGEKGSKIKAIGARARQDLVSLLDRPRPPVPQRQGTQGLG